MVAHITDIELGPLHIYGLPGFCIGLHYFDDIFFFLISDTLRILSAILCNGYLEPLQYEALIVSSHFLHRIGTIRNVENKKRAGIRYDHICSGIIHARGIPHHLVFFRSILRITIFNKTKIRVVFEAARV